ncbi:MAG: serpin family protein [Chloroflexi bacterium]|nr:serpin family protein [Chloroflexota bacterium]
MGRTFATAVMALILVGCGLGAEPPSPASTASTDAAPTAAATDPPATSTSPPSSPAASEPEPSPSPTGSATPGETPAGEIELAKADVARLPADPSEAMLAAQAINRFALDLHRELAVGGENLVFSPMSIAVALGMARSGAKGETADEMDDVLYSVAADDNANWLNSLDSALADRSGTFEDDAGVEHDLTLRIANSYFAQHDLEFEPAFLEVLASRYGAGVHLVDYQRDPESARQLINAWISDQTEERIPEILIRGDVTKKTRLALANAIYLKAPWRMPFQEDLTTQQPFRLADGSKVEVPTMHDYGTLPCASGQDWGAVELPYVGNALSMLVVVPDDLAAFEAQLDADRLGQVVDALTETQARADLALPRFSAETRAELTPVLKALGMVAPFDAADFSGMTTDEQLFIGFVIHQANIDVDEKGTEAAAATVVGMESSGPPEVCKITADRPFLFAIRDVETGAILFLGRADPSASG